ncbi:MAG: NAD(P)/FAD-dependent oxidoreductase [Fimbriimonadia bacterium]|nr:NAD(P)/FAD-dependent oxidoreductase [Fimbriimonadia bacterium]
MTQAPVMIVGGGAAGLTTAAALKMEGIPSVILDKDSQVGGVWTRRYDRLHLHSVRKYSGLAYKEMPSDWPKYVPKDQFVEYLQDYARWFQLELVHDCEVQKVRQEGGNWLLTTSQGEVRAPVVVVATGHYGSAWMPDWEGKDQFSGKLMHSVDYRNPSGFAGKRVLVVGAGNSGAEIAADCAESGAASVALSVRTAPPVAPRDWLGTPVQVFGIALTPLPPGIADTIGKTLARLAIGDLTRYGMPPAAWQPFTAHRIPIIDVGLVKALKQGKVTIKPAVQRLLETEVEFVNGHREPFDVVIAATGFKTRLQELIEPTGLVNERGYPTYPSGEPTRYPGFYFMGYTESVRGHLYEANRDSKRLAKHVKQYLQERAWSASSTTAVS